MSEGAEGFVLAGGQSRRMGRDKALVEAGGEPLIVHALRVLGHAGLKVAIAGGSADLAAYAPIIGDGGGGPLEGILAALASVRSALAVFLPVDMPLVPPSLIGALLEGAALSGAAAASASASAFPQTFPLVVDRALRAPLLAERVAGNRGAKAAVRAAAHALGRPLASFTAEALAQSGRVEHPGGLGPAFWFLNVNTPADLARVEALHDAHRVI